MALKKNKQKVQTNQTKKEHEKIINKKKLLAT